jgi:hypothetical protein
VKTSSSHADHSSPLSMGQVWTEGPGSPTGSIAITGLDEANRSAADGWRRLSAVLEVMPLFARFGIGQTGHMLGPMVLRIFLSSGDIDAVSDLPGASMYCRVSPAHAGATDGRRPASIAEIMRSMLAAEERPSQMSFHDGLQDSRGSSGGHRRQGRKDASGLAFTGSARHRERADH